MFSWNRDTNALRTMFDHARAIVSRIATGQRPELPLRRRRTRARGTGAAAVEFAVVAPVMLLFVLGTIEFGRAMFLQHVAINAARDGCRQAILATATNSTVQATSDSILTSIGITGGTTSMSVAGDSNRNTSSATPGERISVSVTIPYAQNSWLPSSFYLSNKSLVGSVSMSKE